MSDGRAGSYDPKSYWNAREHPNTLADPGISPLESGFIAPRIAGAASLLEMGPGVGRLFPLYRGVPRVDTLDLSTNYRTRAGDAARRAGITVTDHYIDDPLAEFPFADGAFDVGIACHVLMHVPFANIAHTMRQIARTCRKVVVVSAYNRNWPLPGTDHRPDWHCFTHDYAALCERIGCRYLDQTQLAQREGEGSFGFVFERLA